jgi:hypothetical protein
MHLIWYVHVFNFECVSCYATYGSLLQMDMENRFEDWNCLQPSAIVDVTECPIQQPYLNEWEFFSGKKRRHTLKYEVTVHIQTGKLIWTAGPFPGSVHDLNIARSGFVLHLLPNEQVLADKAYIGSPYFITPFCPACTVAQKIFNNLVGRKRVCVEQVIKRMKTFCALHHEWRHELPLHGIVFNVIANIVAMAMMIEPIKAT